MGGEGGGGGGERERERERERPQSPHILPGKPHVAVFYYKG